MRISTAYFAGVGTVIVAVGAGLGGGYLAANVANPPTQAVSKLERRMSAEPISVATAPAEPVPRAAATKPAAAPAQEQTAATAANAAAATQPSGRGGSSVHQSCPRRREARQQRQRPRNPYSHRNRNPRNPPNRPTKRAAAPRDAFARARDADVKRADAEKRRAERRQRWADKRRVQQPREQELEAVEARVREVTEPRRIRIREEGEPCRAREGTMFAEPARSETPRIRLFDQDN